MAQKRIILLLDGTWNDADVGPNDTNIVRLRDSIARALGSPKHTMASECAPDGKVVSGYDFGGRENLVYYPRGVGTGVLDSLRGGIFGEGLGENVRRP
jgi:uncharacterized protein (DUF2235 family)